MNRNTEPRYEITTYNGSTIATRTATREEALAVDRQAVDYVLSLVLGIWAFRTADGQWVESRGTNWPGLGGVSLPIIQALQLNPGEWLSPRAIAEITGCDSLKDPKNLSARLLALRKVHGESFKYPHFFLSRKAAGFMTAWNPTCTWMTVERIG